MELTLSRRRLLAVSAVGAMGALAGCVDPDAAMFVEGVPSDQEIGERATVEPPDDPEYGSLVANATADGEAEAASRTTGNDAPFRPDRPVVHNETVYDISWEPTGRQERHTEYAILLTAHDDGRETNVSYADLPEIDRDRLDGFRQRLESLETEETDPDEERRLPRLELQDRHTDAELNASVLVPDAEYETIEIAGRPVSVETTARTVSREIYRYTATQRAATLAAFGAELRSRHRFELTGLSETERKFFETVAAEGSYYQGSLSDDQEEAFSGLAERLLEEPALFVENRQGEWLLAHDGSDYWVTVDFVRMAEYADSLEAVETL